MKKLYIGNLPYSLNDDGLRSIFEECGSVASAVVILDRDTGRSRGFGFVEFNEDNEADAAIEKMNGLDMDGRSLVVNEARSREGGSRGGGGGGGWGRGGGGGRSGGGGGRGRSW